MSLRLKNTYSRTVERFVPPANGPVRMYTCGPTVYSYAHIGNFRSFLMADLLRRVLERRGQVVRQVMNITDVGHMTQDHLADATGEDKLSKAARELGWDPYQVASHFERLFAEDAQALRLRVYSEAERDDPTLHPRATRHVPEMLAMIQRLLERGYAYVDSAGQVYFEVGKFPEYGQLSGKVMEDLESGARVAVREEKRDPRDFALWKVDAKHLMQWDPHSPAGWPEGEYERFRKLCPGGVDARIRAGFPGWHIECSAMARAHLGPQLDLHTGGEDNIFPHHECEIAQSFGAADDPANAPKTFARYWVHGRHLLVDNKKMAKRDGTFFTVRDLMDPTGNNRADLAAKLEGLGFSRGRVPASVLRYALLSTPFTQPLNFGFDLLVQARASVERLQSRYDRLREVAGPGQPTPAVAELIASCIRELDEALDDNLNTPAALAALFRLTSELNAATLTPADAQAALDAFDAVDQVFDVLERTVRSGLVAKARLDEAVVRKETGADVPSGELGAEAIEQVILARQAAKKAKDFTRADSLRQALKARGVALEDTPQGVRWKRE